jgi:DNA helicase-2/ATP-dependent DNA helicase PcrA
MEIIDAAPVGGEYDVGTGIYHDDYGTGVVVKNGTEGGQFYIIARFESGRTGRFLPEYDAHLEKIESGQWN